MPKKTRRQKQLADKRRQFIDKSSVISVEQPTKPNETINTNLEKPSPSPVIPNQSDQRSVDELRLKTTIIADLKKTAAITLVLFALEFIIFYAKLMGISFGR